MNSLPKIPKEFAQTKTFSFFITSISSSIKRFSKTISKKYFIFFACDLFLLVVIGKHAILPAQKMIGPILNPNGNSLEPLKSSKKGYEVFGFAPYWTFNKLDNVDFETLTTFAYFGVETDGSGNLDREGRGYQTYISPEATEIFKKAHNSGTRVVLTITQMKNGPILALMDDEAAQQNLINQSVAEVKKRGIDGINIDLEYSGNPGEEYRRKFTNFVVRLSENMHREIPESQVTVSVYASAVKEPKIYDIPKLAESADKIFMMAYDFAVAGSDNAIPTAPLYGHKEGKYWYDVSTAVDHFIAQMPSDKLILGVPWYGYNYAVNQPEIKASTTKGYYRYYKKGRKTYSYFVPIRSHAQTYSIVQNEVNESANGISSFQTGWDDFGKVGYKAYYSADSGTWRMVFFDDVRSLSLKYDFAKEKNLAGVGMWALGFDNGKKEFWNLLREKFGTNELANNGIISTVKAKEIK